MLYMRYIMEEIMYQFEIKKIKILISICTYFKVISKLLFYDIIIATLKMFLGKLSSNFSLI